MRWLLSAVEEALAVEPKRTSPLTVQEYDFARAKQALTNGQARLERSVNAPKTD